MKLKPYLLAIALAGACAPTQTMAAPVGMPPQRPWTELERDPVWLANCIVSLEVTARQEPGSPSIRNGPALLQKWRRSLAQYLPDEAARTQRLQTTRQEWARLLEGKSADARHEELDSMVAVCGGEPTRP